MGTILRASVSEWYFVTAGVGAVAVVAAVGGERCEEWRQRDCWG